MSLALVCKVWCLTFPAISLVLFSVRLAGIKLFECHWPNICRFLLILSGDFTCLIRRLNKRLVSEELFKFRAENFINFIALRSS